MNNTEYLEFLKKQENKNKTIVANAREDVDKAKKSLKNVQDQIPIWTNLIALLHEEMVQSEVSEKRRELLSKQIDQYRELIKVLLEEVKSKTLDVVRAQGYLSGVKFLTRGESQSQVID
jgi:hypothetical protein